MKTFNKFLVAVLLVFSLALVAFSFGVPTVAQAATSPSLGTAGTYSILAGSAVTNSGTTVISGNVGISPGTVIPNYTGFGTVTLGGVVHDADVSASVAQGEMNSVYTTAINQPCDTTYPAGIKELAGLSLSPGVYCADSFHLTSGTLTLVGASTDVWIFKSASDLIITGGASAKVVFTGGGLACNVWWRVVSTATFDAGSSFVGNILADTSITFANGASLDGRALARTAEVTLVANNISGPSCTVLPGALHVITNVVNDNGGTAVSSDFNIHVKLSGVDVAGGSTVGVITPGTTYSLAPNTYVVSEEVNASYTKTFSGACDASGNVVLASSSDNVCTITNDDIASATSTINVVKVVVNDNGRSKVIADFPLFVNGTLVVSGVTNPFSAGTYVITETADTNYTQVFSGDCDLSGNLIIAPGEAKTCIITNDDKPVYSGGGGGGWIPPAPPLMDVVKVPSPLALPGGPGLVNYSYTLRNIGKTAINNITMVGDTCSPIILAVGDINNNKQLDLGETWVYTCSTTLIATHTNTVTATGWANGISTVDIASATVVVGLPIVPPLIHITKVPNHLTLPVGGGMVTYTKTITNPGSVALRYVEVVDSKCNPIKYLSGDANSDARLDPSETWVYTCSTKLTKTTVNTAYVTGEANGLKAKDFAIATVVVAVPGKVLGTTITAPVKKVTNTKTPGLPKTGLSPIEKSNSLNIWALFGVSGLALVLLAVAFKKRKV